MDMVVVRMGVRVRAGVRVSMCTRNTHEHMHTLHMIT